CYILLAVRVEEKMSGSALGSGALTIQNEQHLRQIRLQHGVLSGLAGGSFRCNGVRQAGETQECLVGRVYNYIISWKEETVRLHGAEMNIRKGQIEFLQRLAFC